MISIFGWIILINMVFDMRYDIVYMNSYDNHINIV